MEGEGPGVRVLCWDCGVCFSFFVVAFCLLGCLVCAPAISFFLSSHAPCLPNCNLRMAASYMAAVYQTAVIPRVCLSDMGALPWRLCVAFVDKTSPGPPSFFCLVVPLCAAVLDAFRFMFCSLCRFVPTVSFHLLTQLPARCSPSGDLQRRHGRAAGARHLQPELQGLPAV